jgi:hypothetical protein
LPEISSGIAAVRLGDKALAIGDIFGGNAFQVCLFLLADLIAGSPVLPTVGRLNSWLASLGVACVVFALGVAGMLSSPTRQGRSRYARRPRVVREAADLGLGHRRRRRVALQRLERAPEVGDEVRAEIAAEAVPYEHALDGGLLEIRGQRVGGREPAVCAEPVGDVEEVAVLRSCRRAGT